MTSTNDFKSHARSALGSWTFIGVGLALAFAAYATSLADLLYRWNRQEEYSHGYIIPFIVMWLLWRDRGTWLARIDKPSWIGPVLILIAGIMNVVGELSAIFLLAQVGFVIAIYGLVAGFGGLPLLRAVFFPIFLLVFAIPLPYFIDAMLSIRLQLLSSELAAAIIRLLGMPVYVDGNLIDLGDYQLQVIEACNGLRYLFPLMSFGFLAGYLYRGKWWERVVLFLSTIPITVFMNSFRISLVGLTMNQWGRAMADDALHFFEGWIIFIACSALLLTEMWLLARVVHGRGVFQLFSIDRNEEPSLPRAIPSQPALIAKPLVLCFLLLVTTGGLSYYVAQRQELIPARTRFVSFPSTIGDWRGKIALLDPQEEHALGLDDYVLNDYTKGDGKVVNFYVAYYSSQRKGMSPHSPIVCIPGGGWQITNFERTEYQSRGTSFPINRVVIQKGTNKQIVYYWFEQRGRKVANEWLSKAYLVSDAFMANRTDGALIRVTTLVGAGESEADADRRALSLLPDLLPTLASYLPQPLSNSSKRAFFAPSSQEASYDRYPR